jgi:anti-anti-sigma regulatory factor
MVGNARTIDLPAISDIAVCSELQNQLLDAFAQKHDSMVTAHSVRKVSTPCVQIIVAAGLEAERRGLGFALGDMSAVFRDAFGHLGLSEYLERWGNGK